MTTPNIRTALERLVAAADHGFWEAAFDSGPAERDWTDAMAAARAALAAEPVPVPESLKERPDYKAMCAELTDDLEEWVEGYLTSLITDPADECTAASLELIDRARAALAEQPVSQPYKLELPDAEEVPSHKELMELWVSNDWFNEGATLTEFISISRAVLARCGNK